MRTIRISKGFEPIWQALATGGARPGGSVASSGIPDEFERNSIHLRSGIRFDFRAQVGALRGLGTRSFRISKHSIHFCGQQRRRYPESSSAAPVRGVAGRLPADRGHNFESEVSGVESSYSRDAPRTMGFRPLSIRNSKRFWSFDSELKNHVFFL